MCRRQLFGQNRTSRQRPTRGLVLWDDLGSQSVWGETTSLEEHPATSYKPLSPGAELRCFKACNNTQITLKYSHYLMSFLHHCNRFVS